MRLRTRLAGLVAAALALPGLAATPAAADPAADSGALSATAWLGLHATDGELESFGQTDWGLTSDAILGLVAGGASPLQVAPLARAVEAQVGTNYGIFTWEGQEYTDASQVAKLLLVASVTGSDPASYGGINLRSTLLGEVSASGLVGKSSAANVFGQSYAVVGLARTGDVPQSLVTYLLGQQCPQGYFRLIQSSSPCSGAPADRDATAMAVMALRAAKAEGFTGVDAPLASAVAWLVADQSPSGAWTGSEWTPGENSNSTGLVAAALSGLQPQAVAAAKAWTRGLQVTRGADYGAIAYDAESFAAASNGAVPVNDRYQWLRATAQAVMALHPVDFYSMPAVAKVPVDLYTSPGNHAFGGRQWRTTCETYGQTQRCRTDIWATKTAQVNGAFVSTTGWHFNTLTYLPLLTEAQWGSSYLATTGTHTVAGRQWKTECNTPATGGNNCRSWIWASYIASERLSSGALRHYWTQGWLLNNLVRLRPA